MVSVTKKAAQELKNVLKQENKENCAVRIFVAGFGCSGPQYGITLAEEPEKGDEVSESNGVKVFLDKDMGSFLKNAELDYIETEHGAGFVINNASAANGGGCNTCGGGCGH